MSHGAGSAARETRTSRRSEGCCGASSGVATCIPLQPTICGCGLPASTSHLLERGPVRRRIAGITTQISGLRVRIGVELRLVARSGVSLRCQCLTAIGGEADIGRASRSYRSGAIDPQATSASLKSRSAAVSCSIEVCYPSGWKHGRHWPLKRRNLITLLGGAMAAWPLAAGAQQSPSTIPVIGFVYPGVPELSGGVVAAFRKGLNEAGFIEGRNVTVEFRFAYNDNARLPELVRDLVQRGVAVIATPASTPAALAAKAVTATVPIVFGVGRTRSKSVSLPASIVPAVT